ncbi:MAG: ThiF family adenylyltransferase [Sedimentisphaerales bacterium]|nr:ThiF family adenylyltransferase [Sedimentisphaerales bacterium]
MQKIFDAIQNLVDVDYLQHIHLLVIGGGRVGFAFLSMAIHHGISHVKLIEPDIISKRNFASGFPENATGRAKADYITQELKYRRRNADIQFLPVTLKTDKLGAFLYALDWCTHVCFFIDTFPVVTEMVKLAYPARPNLYAALLERGRVGEAAWSIPGQTPCLECTVKLSQKLGATGGETLYVDVLSTVSLVFRQFMGLCLVGRRGFEIFQPFVNPRFCLGYVINVPNSFLNMIEPGTPCGVRLVEVVDEHGIWPSCSICNGYRP